MSLELDGLTGTPTETPAESALPGGTSEGPKAVELADDALVSFKVGGKDQTLPWKEARNGFMFHGDYTRKTMEFAREREAYEQRQAALAERETAVNDRLEQMNAIFSDPNKVAQLAMALNMRQQAAPAGPRPLTDQDLPQLQQQTSARLRQELDEFRQSIATEQHAARLESDLDSFTKGVLAKFPEVSAVDGIEDAIYGRVKALGPSSVEEAKEHIRVMVEQMNTSLNKAWEDKVKRQAVEKSQAARGIEPRGGSPIYPKVPEVKKLEDLDQAFIDYLQHGATG